MHCEVDISPVVHFTARLRILRTQSHDPSSDPKPHYNDTGDFWGQAHINFVDLGPFVFPLAATSRSNSPRDKMAAIAGKWDQIKDTAGKDKKGVGMNIYPVGPCLVSACTLSLLPHDPAQQTCAMRKCLLRHVPLLTPGCCRANVSCSSSVAA